MVDSVSYDRVRSAFAALDRRELAQRIAVRLRHCASGLLRLDSNATLAGTATVALLAAQLSNDAPHTTIDRASQAFSPRFTPADWSMVGAALLQAVAELVPDSQDNEQLSAWGQVWGEAAAAAATASRRLAAQGTRGRRRAGASQGHGNH